MKSFSLYKNVLKSYLMDPLFYVSGIFTILFCCYRFFYAGEFFVQDRGSTDLSLLFNSIPVISIITIPLLVFRVRRFLTDDSLPFSSLNRLLVINLSSFTAFFIPVLFLLLVPYKVSDFGNLFTGQVFTSYIGILFYGFTTVSLTILIFSILNFNSTLGLLISCVVLGAIDFVHEIPMLMTMPDLLKDILNYMSFSWQFDIFARGILDLRTIVFFVSTDALIVFFSVVLEFIRTGRKIVLINVCLFFASTMLFANSFQRMYTKMDYSEGKIFTVSSISKKILSRIEKPVHITYYRSPELSDFFHAASYIPDFIEDYCRLNPNVTFTIEDAKTEHMTSLGIQAMDQRREKDGKIEYLSLYSAIVVKYLDQEELLHFVMDINSLEYDLTRSIQHLLFDKKNRVYLLSGNDLGFTQSESLLEYWLTNRGFDVHIINEDSMISTLDMLSENDTLFIKGTQNFSREQALAIENAYERGVNTIICTTPYTADYTQNNYPLYRNNHDNLLPLIQKIGFTFDSSLISDVSCFAMEFKDSTNGQTISQNYPNWIFSLPQKENKDSMLFLWPSPISTYKNVVPIITTSEQAWSVAEDHNSEVKFYSNPFIMAKSAKEADAERTGRLNLAARLKDDIYSVTVISDQYFASLFLTNEQIPNLDFIAREILILSDQEDLANLINKAPPTTRLDKIQDESLYEETKNLTLFLCFVLGPFILILTGISFFIYRKKHDE